MFSQVMGLGVSVVAPGLGASGRATPEGASGCREDGRFCLTFLCEGTSLAGRFRRPYLGTSDGSDMVRCVVSRECCYCCCCCCSKVVSKVNKRHHHFFLDQH